MAKADRCGQSIRSCAGLLEQVEEEIHTLHHSALAGVGAGRG